MDAVSRHYSMIDSRLLKRRSRAHGRVKFGMNCARRRRLATTIPLFLARRCGTRSKTKKFVVLPRGKHVRRDSDFRGEHTEIGALTASARSGDGALHRPKTWLARPAVSRGVL